MGDDRIEALARVWTPHIFSGIEDDEGNDLHNLQYDNLPPDWQQRMREMASDGLHALHRAGLRVVPAEPSEADVERVANALIRATAGDWVGWRKDMPLSDNYALRARAAIAAYMAQGGGDGIA